MKKILIITLIISSQFANAQVDKFTGSWISTTQLISQIGEIAHFTIDISIDSDKLYLSYCYVSPDQKNRDCMPQGHYAAIISIAKIKGKSFEVDFVTSQNEKGKVLITQSKQYLYWNLIVRPPNSDYLPQEEIFAHNL